MKFLEPKKESSIHDHTEQFFWLEENEQELIFFFFFLPSNFKEWKFYFIVIIYLFCVKEKRLIKHEQTGWILHN